MPETEALEFFDEVVGGESGKHASPGKRKKKTLEASNGKQLTIELVPVDRKEIIDELNKLPDELLEIFSEVEDPEEAQVEAEAADALGGLSGGAIDAFETICAKGMEHPELTSQHFDRLAGELSLEVLFELGAEIIEMSLEDDGRITDFHDRD